MYTVRNIAQWPCTLIKLHSMLLMNEPLDARMTHINHWCGVPMGARILAPLPSFAHYPKDWPGEGVARTGNAGTGDSVLRWRPKSGDVQPSR